MQFLELVDACPYSPARRARPDGSRDAVSAASPTDVARAFENAVIVLSRLRLVTHFTKRQSASDQMRLKSLDRRIVKFIKANPGTLGKDIADGVGIRAEQFRKIYSGKLRLSGARREQTGELAGECLPDA
jgi:hypothetical protein